MIAGFVTDIELTCVDAFTVPDDPAGLGKLLLSLHYYTPYTFCGLDTVETWGTPATTWGNVRESPSRVLWMTSGSQAALSRGMVPVLWDTGSEIERADGSFSPEFQAVMESVGPN